MPWVGLQCVIVVFPDHTHLFLNFISAFFTCSNNADIFSKSILVKIRNFFCSSYINFALFNNINARTHIFLVYLVSFKSNTLMKV